MSIDNNMTNKKEAIDMTIAKVIETNDPKVATKEEVDKLYQYFAKKNKSIYERLAK